MKLNNKGFGMRESLIYLCILLMVLLVAACSVSSFYDTLEESRSDNHQEYYLFDVDEDDEKDDSQVIDDKDSSIVINYDYYHIEEERFANAALEYARANGLNDSVNQVNLTDLYKSNHMTRKIVDYVDGKTCGGYANVSYNNGSYDVEAFILCTNYKTKGYR
jgi:competence protein ComGF